MCKKISAILIVLVMVFSAFSLSVFAVEQENINPSSGDVLVKYDDGGHPATYSVDITWGAMKFDYKANEVWNPETHKWEVNPYGAYCEPVGDSNIITVANNSSVPVDAVFSFDSLSEYAEISGGFYSENSAFYDSSVVMPVAREDAEAEIVSVEFRLWGEFTSELEDYTKVGAVTVTLTDHDDLYYSLINGDTEYEVARVRTTGTTKITVPAEYNGKPVTSVGEGAFSHNDDVTEVVLPNSIETIGYQAFYECENLQKVTLNEGLISIGEQAFESCYSLESITIPSSVQSIGKRALAHCRNLTNISVDSANETYHSVDNCIVETTSKTLVAGCPASEIPNDGSVTKIGECAFYFCNGLKKVNINSNIVEIGEHAFSGSDTLISVYISDSVDSIGYGAFRQCINLTNVRISNRTSAVDDQIGAAFAGNTGLYVIKTADASAFTFGSEERGGVAKYAKVFIADSGITYKTEEDGTTYLLESDFLYSVKDGEYVLIAYVGENDTVTLPETIESKSYTLHEVKGLLNVTIPSTFTKINDRAFYCARGIGKIVVPEGVQSIGDSAFERCSNLLEMDIPLSVTSIENKAFYGSRSLSVINYAGTKAQWEAITKGTNWEPNKTCTVICTDGVIE